MIQGSCLCGAVRWRYAADFERVTHCHCSMCRKAHGAPFATYAMGVLKNFELLGGADAKVKFESSPRFIRSFCGHCGSVVPNTDLGELVAVPVGGIEGCFAPLPSAHIFAKWKAPWHEITDQLPQHDNYPGQSEPAVQRNVLAAANAGVLRGSCLCGDVAFEVSGEFDSVHNCYCSRCRRARAAVHTTNGFVGIDQLQFVRGENQVKEFRPPDARVFTHAFCSRCGSGMARRNHEHQFGIIPFGALDDDPGRGADDHIFVDDKFEWYPIDDDRPQFSAMP